MVNVARTMETADTHSSDEYAGEPPHLLSTEYDRQVLLRPVVGDRIRLGGYISTIWVALLLLFFTLLMWALVLALAIAWPLKITKECERFYLAVYIRVSYWALTFVYDHYIRRKHAESRIEGFLDFFKEIVSLARAPHFTTNIMTILLFVVVSVFHQSYGDMKSRCLGELQNDPTLFVAIFISLESIIVSALLVAYIFKIRSFNRKRSPPDSMTDEWMASFIRNSYNGGEVGYRESDNHFEDLLERQADLLRCLKEQNTRLVQKVMILSSQLQEKHGARVS